MTEPREVLARSAKSISGTNSSMDVFLAYADVLLADLAEAGYEVVKLPEPDQDQGDGIAFWWSQQREDVGADNGLVHLRHDGDIGDVTIDPDNARALAAALLAAAAFGVSHDQ